MKILLILPKDSTYYYKGLFKKSLSYAPLTLTCLASLVPEELNASIDIIDEGVQSFMLKQEFYDVVGITCVTSSSPRAYYLAQKFKKEGSFIIMGGAHPTLNPKESSNYADVVITGYAEILWPQILLDWYHKKNLQKIYYSEPITQLKSSIPSRQLNKKKAYLAVPTVIASRGCINNCSYCSIHKIWHRSSCPQPLSDVIDDIKKLKTNRVLFLDPNLTADRDFAKELFKALIPLKINWAGLTTADIVTDSELFDLMIKSGCDGLLMGFESISEKSLQSCLKKASDISIFKQTVTQCHNNNIRVLGCFVLGFDHDTQESLDRTIDFIDDTKIDIPRFAVLTPFPGTELFSTFKKEGRILSEDWNLYNTENVVFQPKNLSAEELQLSLYQIWNKAYSLKRIVRRIKQVKKSYALVTAINFGFRHYAKQMIRRAKIN